MSKLTNRLKPHIVSKLTDRLKQHIGKTVVVAMLVEDGGKQAGYGGTLLEVGDDYATLRGGDNRTLVFPFAGVSYFDLK